MLSVIRFFETLRVLNRSITIPIKNIELVTRTIIISKKKFNFFFWGVLLSYMQKDMTLQVLLISPTHYL